MAIEIFGKSMSDEDFARELKKRKAEMEKEFHRKMLHTRARNHERTPSMMHEMNKLQLEYDKQMYHYHQLMAKAQSDMDSILGMIPPKSTPLETHSFKWIDMGDDKKIPDSITSKEKLTPAEIGERYGKGLLEQLEGQKQEYEKLTMKHLEDVIKDLASTRKKFPMTPAEAMEKAFGEPKTSPILGVVLDQMDDVALDQLHKGVMEEIDIPAEEKSAILTHICAEQAARGPRKTRRGFKKTPGGTIYEEAGKFGKGGFVFDQAMAQAADDFHHKVEMDMLFGTAGKVRDDKDFTLITGTAGHKAFEDAMKVQHMSTKGVKVSRPTFHMEHLSEAKANALEKAAEEDKLKSSTPVVPNLGGSLRQTRSQKLYDKIRKAINSTENRYEL